MQLTTFSPSKLHAKNALFSKHPSKTPAKTKKTPDRVSLEPGLIFPAKKLRLEFGEEI
jgi:hypothetical protein